MKKVILFCILYFGMNVSYAASCPTPDQIFVKRGSQYIPVPPAGWQFVAKWPSHLDSADIAFQLAAYGADLHPDTDADNHVRCYYGNPDLTVDHGVAIETDSVIDESLITSHSQWQGKKHYYMCTDYTNHDVSACVFG